MMWDKQKYAAYLSETRKNDGTIHQYLDNIDKLHEFIPKYKEENPQFSVLTAVEAFFAQYNVAHMYSVYCGIIKCLTEYANYLLKNSKDSELLGMADAIKETLSNKYKQKAVHFAAGRKTLIVPIPNNASIEQKYLNGLENEEFISAFLELQNRIISIYDEIEVSPFDWGFPDFEQNEGYYHRVADNPNYTKPEGADFKFCSVAI